MYTLYYLILNDDYSTIHYVGITSKSLKERLQTHIYQCKNKHYQNRIYQKGYLQRFLLKHLNDSTISLIEVKSELSKKEAILFEKEYIQFLKLKHPLKNTSSGGELFDESSHIYNKIYQYDLEGNLLNIFNGSTKAAKHIGLSSKGKINDCCNGKLRHVKNFIWRYENDSFNKFSLIDKRKRDLFIVYDIKGNILHNNILGFKKVANILNLKKSIIGYNSKYPFTKDGRIKIIENKFVVINKSYPDTITKVEEYLKTKDAICLNKISKGYGKRIKRINSEIIVIDNNKQYFIFKSLEQLKEIIINKSFSRNLAPYLIQPTLYKSTLLFLFDNKTLTNKNIINIEKRIGIKFNPNNFQENKDIVRSIGKPMMVDEFLAKIQ